MAIRKAHAPGNRSSTQQPVRCPEGGIELPTTTGLPETKLRDLLESMPDGIIMVDSGGRIVLANQQARNMFCYAAGELAGKSVEKPVPARFRMPHAGHRHHYFSQPRTRTMGMGLQLYGLRRDGTEFPVEISLSPMETKTAGSSPVPFVTSQTANRSNERYRRRTRNGQRPTRPRTVSRPR